MMDNLSSHRGIAGETLAQILALKNSSLVYLPPYSPDLNPIENTFGTIKYYLKDDPYSFITDPLLAILLACKKVTGEQVKGWYKLCGYQ